MSSLSFAERELHGKRIEQLLMFRVWILYKRKGVTKKPCKEFVKFNVDIDSAYLIGPAGLHEIKRSRKLVRLRDHNWEST